MYMLKAQPYRKRIHEGDTFLLNFPDNLVIPVLVARVKPTPDDMVLGGYLIYTYNPINRAQLSPACFTPGNMMFKPMFINRLGWSKGYFEKYETDTHDMISRIPKQHCFQHLLKKSVCFNEWGEQIPCTPEPSSYALTNYRRLDLKIAKAMGWDTDLAGRV